MKNTKILENTNKLQAGRVLALDFKRMSNINQSIRGKYPIRDKTVSSDLTRPCRIRRHRYKALKDGLYWQCQFGIHNVIKDRTYKLA